MSRATDLLRAAAAALEDGRDPFGNGFLVEHDVTLDECFDLGEHLAIGARLLAYAAEHPAEMVGAVNGANLAHAYKRLTAGLAAYTDGGAA